MLPWTNWVLTQLPAFPIGPAFTITMGILIIGIILYWKESDISLEDLVGEILSFLKMRISFTKKVNRRKLTAGAVIILSFFATITLADASWTVQATTGGGGGPSLYKCLDLSVLACWTGNSNSGTVLATNSTLCTTGNNLCGKYQSGTTTCAISSTILHQYNYGCDGTIAFPKAFTSIPTAYGMRISSISSTNVLSLQVPYAVLPIEADNGTTWRNMPAAVTPLYGNNNHQVFDEVTSADSIYMSVNCITPSTSLTAYLTLQYSTDDAVWTSFGVGMRTDVSSGGPCVLQSPIIVNSAASILFPLADCGCYFRVVGANGAGAGDNPIFNNIQIFVQKQLGLQFPITIGQIPGTTNDLSTTIMPFWIQVSWKPSVDLTLTLKWWACTC